MNPEKKNYLCIIIYLLFRKKIHVKNNFDDKELCRYLNIFFFVERGKMFINIDFLIVILYFNNENKFSMAGLKLIEYIL